MSKTLNDLIQAISDFNKTHDIGGIDTPVGIGVMSSGTRYYLSFSLNETSQVYDDLEELIDAGFEALKLAENFSKNRIGRTVVYI